jgi:hypothetical protein
LFDGCADRGFRDLWRVGAAATLLHVWKLIAERRHALVGKFGRNRLEERMCHACSGSVRQHEAGMGGFGCAEEAGNLSGPFNVEGCETCLWLHGSNDAKPVRLIVDRKLAFWYDFRRKSRD